MSRPIFFQLTFKSPRCKKKYFENQEIILRFSIKDRNAPDAPQKNTRYYKSPGVPLPSWSLAVAAEALYEFF